MRLRPPTWVSFSLDATPHPSLGIPPCLTPFLPSSGTTADAGWCCLPPLLDISLRTLLLFFSCPNFLFFSFFSSLRPIMSSAAPANTAPPASAAPPASVASSPPVVVSSPPVVASSPPVVASSPPLLSYHPLAHLLSLPRHLQQLCLFSPQRHRPHRRPRRQPLRKRPRRLRAPFNSHLVPPTTRPQPQPRHHSRVRLLHPRILQHRRAKLRPLPLVSSQSPTQLLRVRVLRQFRPH
ncbi:hypothetical protein DFH94DRAFT_341219 [Russula ochroleuca]|uniref:Uncharacterized protein n=1 Tax=Russula ochroleuca TaxID=152965 RepID=A0A9P5JX10_9AGAM|nr:hypothetical protein DFH94DRAFT_341219 [Russula ochroleuca]